MPTLSARSGPDEMPTSGGARLRDAGTVQTRDPLWLSGHARRRQQQRATRRSNPSENPAT